MIRTMVVLLVTLLSTAAVAHDDGRYANSDLKQWFNTLASKKGLCCSFADGVAIQDVDWDSSCQPEIASVGGLVCTYRVHLDGQWLDVPDAAVITEPNKAGTAIVWPYKDSDGKTQIRCFIAGSGT